MRVAQDSIVKDDSLHTLTKTSIDLYSCMKPRKPVVREIEKVHCTLLRKGSKVVCAKFGADQDNMRLEFEKKALLFSGQKMEDTLLPVIGHTTAALRGSVSGIGGVGLQFRGDVVPHRQIHAVIRIPEEVKACPSQ